MTKRIFKSILVVSTVALVICVFAISYFLYGYFGTIIKEELKSKAVLISEEVEENEDYLSEIGNIQNRITLIDQDGTVLFDSRKDAADMENHYDREEVAEARENGEAFSSRYSDTLATKTIYYAMRLDNGDILRISQDQNVVTLLLRGIIGPVVLIMAVIILFASVISKHVSRSIVNPINDIDLNDPQSEIPYSELSPLMRKIRRQYGHINAQVEEIRRQQKEFMAIMENMREGFLLVDKNMEVLSYNTAALDMLDGEAEGEHVTAFQINRSAGFREAVEKSLAGEYNRSLIYRNDKKYSITADPVFENNDVIGAVIIISEEK